MAATAAGAGVSSSQPKARAIFSSEARVVAISSSETASVTRRADAVDDGAEALLGRAALIGERPAVALGGDPAALDEPVQLVVVQRTTGGDGAVDDVQDPPVAAAAPLGLEGGGELGRHQAIGGLQPVAEGAGGVVWVLCVRVFMRGVL